MGILTLKRNHRAMRQPAPIQHAIGHARYLSILRNLTAIVLMVTLALAYAPAVPIQPSPPSHELELRISRPSDPLPNPTLDGSPSAHLDTVDPMGAYKSTVPIEVPDYYGIEPELALTYDSNSGNGVISRGWSLRGDSRIVRASRTHGVPSYDDSDAYYLDGMELLPCAGSSTTSVSCVSGGTHSTRTEGYFRIQRDGSVWRLWTKDGSRSTYSPQPNSHSKGTYQWSLSEVEDTRGHKVVYKTWCEPLHSSNQCYLKHISYGNTSNEALKTQVEMFYEERDDRHSYAIGGGLAFIGHRLKTIQVKAAGEQLRAYRLRYREPHDVPGSHLGYVEQFGRDANVNEVGDVSGTPLPAREFGLGPPPADDRRWRIDANSHDSGPTFTATPVGSDGSAEWQSEPGVGTYKAGWFGGDVDGDGRQDFISPHWSLDNKIELRVVKSLRDGGLTAPIVTATPWEYGSKTSWPQDWRILPGDVNADGRTDILAVINNPDTGSTWLYTGMAQPSGQFHISASGKDLSIPWDNPWDQFRNEEDHIWTVGDANADGRADLMVVERRPSFMGAPEAQVYADLVVVLTTVAPATDGAGEPVIGHEIHRTPTNLRFKGGIEPYGFDPNGPYSCADSALNAVWLVGDTNGDGKSDFIRVEDHPTGEDWRDPYQEGWIERIPRLAIRSALSYGNGRLEFTPEMVSEMPWTRTRRLPCASFFHDRVHVGDFDGDGRSDVVWLSPYRDVDENGNTRGTFVRMDTLFSRGDGSYDRRTDDTRLSALFLAVYRQLEYDEFGQPTMHPNIPAWMTGDFNGDRATDFVIAGPAQDTFRMGTWPTTITLAELISDKKGKYLGRVRRPTPWRLDDYCAAGGRVQCSTSPNDLRLSFDIFAGDVNGDSTDDVMYAGPADSFGDPPNSTKTNLRTDLSPNSIADVHRWQPTDLNGDGRKDLVYVSYRDPGIRVHSSLEAAGDGRVNVPPQDLLADFDEANIRNWIVGDVGGLDGKPDGRADLVYVAPTQVSVPSTGTKIYTLLSRGDGTWVPLESTHDDWPMEDSAHWRLSDIDGDGRADLVNTWIIGNQLQVVVLFSNGDGDWVRDAKEFFAGIDATDASNWRTTDVNGDGRGDLVHIHYPGGGQDQVVRTLLASGRSRWEPVSQPIPADQFELDTSNWQVAELNGDGAADLVKASMPDVLGKDRPADSIRIDELISLGDGHWKPQTRWPNYSDSEGDSLARAEVQTRHWMVLDSNADGLSDLTQVSPYQRANTRFSKLTVHTLLNGAEGWRPERQTDILYSYRDAPAWKPVDWHSDGQDGLLYMELALQPSGERQVVARYLRSIRRTTLIRREYNSIGLSTVIEYTTSAGSNVSMPLGALSTVVRSIRTYTHPVKSEATTTYRYEGARWSYATKSSLGFARITSSDGATMVVWDYRQTPGCVTMPTAITRRQDTGPVWIDATGIIQRTRFEYLDQSESQGPPYACLIFRRINDEFEYSANPRSSSTRYEYDAYGNQVKILDEGEFWDQNSDGVDDYSSDNRLEVRTYHPNVDKYIVALRSEVSNFDEHDRRIFRQRLLYDNGNTSSPPSVGNLTTEEVWNDKANRWARTKYEYDAYGNSTKVTDPTGRWTSTGYDPVFNYFPLTSCTPLFCSSQQWDMTLGKLSVTTDPNANSTEFKYDAYGRPRLTRLPDGGCTATFYLDHGIPEKQRTVQQTCTRPFEEPQPEQGLWTARYFDGQDRAYKTTRTGGFARETSHLGATSLVESETAWHAANEAAVTERYSYDPARRRTKVTHQDGTYTEVRRAVGVELTADEVLDQKIKYTDARGRMIAVRERVTHEGQVLNYDTSYGYDAFDRLTSVVDANGNKSTSTWNSLGHRLMSCDPDLGCRTFTYYDNGLLESQTDAKRQRIRFSYDPNGRLREKRYGRRSTPSDPRVRWFYDFNPTYKKKTTQGASIGKITRVEDPGGTGSEQYWYDKRGNVERTKKCVNPRCVEWVSTYDAAGRLWRLSYPDVDGRVSAASEIVEYQYNSRGMLNSVASLGNQPMDYVDELRYDANGRTEVAAYGNRVTASYGYHPKRHWLSTIEVRDSHNSVAFFAQYTRDAASRADTISIANPMPMSFSLGHDELGRLRTVRGARSQNFDYDALGNMTYNSDVGVYKYRNPNHIHAVTQAGKAAYRYDENGNLRAGDGRRFTWDEDNRPIRIRSQAGTTRFAYDAAGTRIRKTAPDGRTSRYFGPYVELDPKGRLVKHYFAGSKRVARRDHNGVQWYHEDVPGSISLVTNATGQVIRRYNYLSFGGPMGPPYGSQDAAGFAGHEADNETGLIFMGARYYDPKVARFISADTVVPDQTNPQALNRYSYAYNSPYNYSDPTGHRPENCYSAEYRSSACTEEPEDVSSTGWPILRGFETRLSTTDLLREEEAFRENTKPTLDERGNEATASIRCESCTFGLPELSLSSSTSKESPEPSIWDISLETLKELPRMLLLSREERAREVAAALERSGQSPNTAAANAHTFLEGLCEACKLLGGALGFKLGLPLANRAASWYASRGRTVDLSGRAAQIQNVLKDDPIAHRDRVTSVIEATDSQGNTWYIVSNSSGRLTPAQRALLGPRDIPVTGIGHAEAQGLAAATKLGLKPVGIGASKAICPSCSFGIGRTPAVPDTPFKWPN
jgi:RHS repeat-associated protein